MQATLLETEGSFPHSGCSMFLYPMWMHAGLLIMPIKVATLSLGSCECTRVVKAWGTCGNPLNVS